jgi:hypothetical protein
MKHFDITKHATLRLAQRAISIADAKMIVKFGTEVDGGYIFLEKDCDVRECELKAALQQVRRLRGKRVVLEDGHLVTAYRATTATTRRLLRSSEERQQEIWS